MDEKAVCGGPSSPFIFAKYSRRMYIIVSNKSNKHLNQFNSSSSSRSRTNTTEPAQEKGNRAHARIP